MKNFYIVVLFLAILMFSCNFSDDILKNAKSSNFSMRLGTDVGLNNMLSDDMFYLFFNGIASISDKIKSIGKSDNPGIKDVFDVKNSEAVVSSGLTASESLVDKVTETFNEIKNPKVEGIAFKDMEAGNFKLQGQITTTTSTKYSVLNTSNLNDAKFFEILLDDNFKAFFQWLNRNQDKKKLIDLMKKLDERIEKSKHNDHLLMDNLQKWSNLNILNIDCNTENDIVSSDENARHTGDGAAFVYEYLKDSKTKRYSLILLLEGLFKSLDYLGHINALSVNVGERDGVNKKIVEWVTNCFSSLINEIDKVEKIKDPVVKPR
ncbi:hypothetical protein bcCo53_001211 (plasmid) [Borrelia coriaceae]|uniref:Uncharacterized protein n=1 Tax=Borrelia coriaceae ATCC 43381 TaxID=1408429 RepID=W5SV32_9SPIR|nr:hypothetical protein [Borrelia coriaceae]AHH11079.1 hypothetical protein BCO_0900022 [Borrelia coriaceae ATCC 43381]UPA17042.1 hypothetical protein bcCo53_001211 [Borrelia coriaceae]